MRGCSRRRRHRGGDAGLNLAYTGRSAPQSITNPFLAYTGKGGCGGGGGSCPFMKGGADVACNSSAPANAATFLAYDGKGGCHGIKAPVGGVTATMLGAAEVVNSGAANLPTQQGGMGTGGVTAAMLGAAEVVSSAPDTAAQQMGGGAGVADAAAPVTGYPAPGPDANVALSDSGSVYSGSAPYLVTGGMAPDIAKAPLWSPRIARPPKGGALSSAYPSTAGTPAHVGWINNQTLQGGGGCGCGGPLTLGGGRRRRRRTRRHRGGRNFGDPVPNGLLGQSWTGNVATWPGVDGVAMNRGHYDLNTYATDVSRQTQAVGANFPFSGLSWKGGRGRGRRHRRTRRRRTRSRRHRGGALSNYLSQDIINLGREFGFSTQSAYNTLTGQPAPVNPMPWKDQLTSIPHK